MSGPYVRWSQTVRKPGLVEILSSHAVDLPALGDGTNLADARPAIRLIVRSLGDSPYYDTIDITSTAAIAMLEGWLHSGAHVGKALSWVSRGSGRYRRDTIILAPMRP